MYYVENMHPWPFFVFAVKQGHIISRILFPMWAGLGVAGKGGGSKRDVGFLLCSPPKEEILLGTE